MYRVFVRNWWRENAAWPNGLEPYSGGTQYHLATNVETVEEAREIAQDYNKTHEPGRLSRKAEFEEQ